VTTRPDRQTPKRRLPSRPETPRRTRDTTHPSDRASDVIGSWKADPQTVEMQYELSRQIGEGGMATVYLAQASTTAGFRQQFALKCLRKDLRTDRVARALFNQEAALAGLIRHPNCLAALDRCELDGEAYIVMELVEAVSLKHVLRHFARRNASLSLELIARVMLDALAGVAAIHDASDQRGRHLGIVHQDLSVQNLLLTNAGITRVSDLGSACVRRWPMVTEPGLLIGTLNYVAPERLTGSGRADPRSDLYSLGVVMWELFTGQHLVPSGGTIQATIRTIHESNARRPSDYRPVPPSLEEVCMRSLNKDPDKRYQTAVEFRQDLRIALLESDIVEYDDGALQHTMLVAGAGPRPSLNGTVAEFVLAERRSAPPPVG